MRRFAEIEKQAAARKGGPKALKALLPEVKPAAELRSIPDDRWLAAMTRGIFQSGFSWKVIENKWPGFEAAFHRFEPGRNALMSDEELDALTRDARIVRNAQKIASVRENAGFLLDLAREHGSAAACFADWPNQDFAGLLALLKKRGSRMGGNTGPYMLRTMGRDSYILTRDVTAALIREGVIDKPPGGAKAMAAVQAAFNAWAAESGHGLAAISRILALSVDDPE
ncbi:DNA-3-methyladenine glycosylase I [Marinibaculum pumilum]|uniref:DNA-3-methyladenine glycosylase I n=1 Tax=Marinibaculum pumilum TaxID=1766165 RepID=A0ABV7KTS1_9PROT